MRAKHFLLGTLTGVIATAVAVVLIVVLLAMQPLPDVVEPPPGEAGDVVVSVREEYLSKLGTEMARSELEDIRQVLVDVRPAGRVDMTVRARVVILGLEMEINVTMVSSLAVVGDELAFTVHRIGVAGLNIPLDLLPESLRAALRRMEAMANQEANALLKENDLIPVSVASDDTTITITVRSR
jgi:hypothetical protein